MPHGRKPRGIALRPRERSQKYAKSGAGKGAALCVCFGIVFASTCICFLLFYARLRGELRIVQVTVKALLFHELRVRALLDDRALVHDEDEVGI